MQLLNTRGCGGHGTGTQERVVRPIRDPMPDGRVIKSARDQASQRPRSHVLLDVGLVLIGLALLIGGVRLVRLGGSWDYVIVGAAVLITGFLIVRGRLAVAELFPRR
jgi:hypothetical protein